MIVNKWWKRKRKRSLSLNVAFNYLLNFCSSIIRWIHYFFWCFSLSLPPLSVDSSINTMRRENEVWFMNTQGTCIQIWLLPSIYKPHIHCFSHPLSSTASIFVEFVAKNIDIKPKTLGYQWVCVNCMSMFILAI